MRPEVELAKLTAHPINMAMVSRGAFYVHSPSIRPEHVAAACSFAKLPRKVYLFALRKWCGDETVHRELSNYAYIDTAGMVAAKGWPVESGKQQYRKLSGIAMDEAISAQVCPTCHGVGHINVHQCEDCQGFGRKSWSGRELARRFGCDERWFRRVWRDRYNDIAIMLHGWDMWGLAEIGRALREEEGN